jgi:cell division protein FtsB
LKKYNKHWKNSWEIRKRNNWERQHKETHCMRLFYYLFLCVLSPYFIFSTI